VIQEQLDRGARDEGRQLFEEFDGLEEEVRCSIAPHCFEFDEDAPVGAEAEAVLCERGLTLPPTRRREFALALLHARLKSLEIGVKRTKGGQAGRSVEDQGVTVDGLLEAYLLARDLCGVHERGTSCPSETVVGAPPLRLASTRSKRHRTAPHRQRRRRVLPL
jgi:hypothetical protein